MTRKPKVLALITTFFPKFEIIQAIENLKKQVDCLMIIDNGSGVENLEFIKKFENDERVKIVLNGKNMGIAWSCNFAAKFMLENGFDWLATFDQDSSLDGDYISKMLQVAAQIEIENKMKISEKNSQSNKLLEIKNENENENKTLEKLENQSESLGKIGLICPAYFYESTQVLQRQNKTQSDFCKIIGAMSSGSLVSREVFENGIFCEEKLFVDYFDSEFQLAVQSGGFEVFEASKIVLNHQLGNISKKTLFGKTFIPTNYPPFRRYYQARNRIFVYSKYWHKFPKFCLRDFKSNLLDVLKMYLSENNKLAKTKAILLGTMHGIIGKFENPAPKFD